MRRVCAVYCEVVEGYFERGNEPGEDREQGLVDDEEKERERHGHCQEYDGDSRLWTLGEHDSRVVLEEMAANGSGDGRPVGGEACSLPV